MDKQSLKTTVVQQRGLVPYILVAVVAAIIALGSFMGGIAYQKSTSTAQPDLPQLQNGTFPNGGFRQRQRGTTDGTQQDGQQGIDAPLDSGTAQ